MALSFLTGKTRMLSLERFYGNVLLENEQEEGAGPTKICDIYLIEFQPKLRMVISRNIFFLMNQKRTMEKNIPTTVRAPACIYNKILIHIPKNIPTVGIF